MLRTIYLDTDLPPLSVTTVFGAVQLEAATARLYAMTSNNEQIIQKATGYATQAASEVDDFVGRAELTVALVIALRDVLFNEVTSGTAPDGREWEVRQLDKVRDAAENYRTEAYQMRNARASS